MELIAIRQIAPHNANSPMCDRQTGRFITSEGNSRSVRIRHLAQWLLARLYGMCEARCS